MKINMKVFRDSVMYSKDVIEIVKEYSIFMDRYFESDDMKEKHKEIYIAYQKMSENMKNKAKMRGLI